MRAQVDVLAVLGELRALHMRTQGPVMSSTDGSLDRIDSAITAVAELIEQMRDVMALWDSSAWSIDAKAAALQCRPDKWRDALAHVGGAA